MRRYAATDDQRACSTRHWEKTALICVYDEHGGWYDHVPPAGRPARQRRAEITVPPDHPGSYDYTASGSRVRGFAWSNAITSPTSRLRPHLDPEIRRDQVEPAGPDLPRCQRTQHVRLLRLHGHAAPFTEPPTLAAPKNPFSSPAALPSGSLSAADQAMFHTTCTELPAGSLPPASAKVSSVPPHAVARMAAQEKRIQGEVRAQG